LIIKLLDFLRFDIDLLLFLFDFCLILGCKLLNLRVKILCNVCHGTFFVLLKLFYVILVLSNFILEKSDLILERLLQLFKLIFLGNCSILSLLDQLLLGLFQSRVFNSLFLKLGFVLLDLVLDCCSICGLAIFQILDEILSNP